MESNQPSHSITDLNGKTRGVVEMVVLHIPTEAVQTNHVPSLDQYSITYHMQYCEF